MDDLKKYCKKCQNYKIIDFYGKKIDVCYGNVDYRKCVINKSFRGENNNDNIR